MSNSEEQLKLVLIFQRSAWGNGFLHMVLGMAAFQVVKQVAIGCHRLSDFKRMLFPHLLDMAHGTFNLALVLFQLVLRFQQCVNATATLPASLHSINGRLCAPECWGIQTLSVCLAPDFLDGLPQPPWVRGMVWLRLNQAPRGASEK